MDSSSSKVEHTTPRSYLDWRFLAFVCRAVCMDIGFYFCRDVVYQICHSRCCHLTSRRSQPPLALAVPLSRFTPRVGGGSAFYVRLLHTYYIYDKKNRWRLLLRVGCSVVSVTLLHRGFVSWFPALTMGFTRFRRLFDICWHCAVAFRGCLSGGRHLLFGSFGE